MLRKKLSVLLYHQSVKKRVPKDMHELRVGKLNTQLLQEVAGEGDETRVRRVLGKLVLNFRGKVRTS